jgi:DNA polymerase I-like protein with 3'-5' exonuclease and polymerase domains
LESLAVGHDGRNRCLLSPFRSTTGRNQPSNARFVFGPSCWIRSLIQPPPGRAIAYIDWSQQEHGIAAALSGDPKMQAAYSSGDPYLTFAKQAGAVPVDATKQSHPREREQFKVCTLAVQYGMGPESLARSLNQPLPMARELLRLHRQTYPVFWAWSDGAVNHAMLRGWLCTVFGWRVHVGPWSNPRSLGNFPMQANGAEMLRLACCLATENGIDVIAPVHDAVLIEAPADELQATVERMQAAMAEASRVVLNGFELASDAKLVYWPDRYADPRGETMWKTVVGLAGGMSASATTLLRQCTPVVSY